MRKQMYALLEAVIDRELTHDEHNQVKTITEAYIKGVLNGLDINETPRTHYLICTECAAKKTVVGYKEIKSVYKGKRRGFVAE